MSDLPTVIPPEGLVLATTWKTPGADGCQVKHVWETLSDFARRIEEARANGWTALRSWYRVVGRGEDGSPVVVPDFLPCDMDAKGDLPRTFTDARKLLAVLAGFDIPRLTIPIYFSGSKGVMIHVPAAMFRPDPQTLDVWKARGKAIAEDWRKRFGIETLDLRVFETVGLFREGNTKHLDGGAWRIPMLPEDLAADPEEVRALAKVGPRDLDLAPEDTAPTLSADLAAAMRAAIAGSPAVAEATRGPKGERELPRELPARTRRILDALPWRTEIIRKGNGQIQAIKVLDRCPACAPRDSRGRMKHGGTAWITPVTARLKCFHESSCDAGSEGLAPEDWLPRFCPEALPALAVPRRQAPAPPNVERVHVEELPRRLAAVRDEADKWAQAVPGRAAVVAVTVGAGKTEAEMRAAWARGGTGTILAPTHALADEIENRYARIAGDEAGDDPPSEDAKAKADVRRFMGAPRLCILPNEDARREAVRAAGPWGLRKVACPFCPYRESCPAMQAPTGDGLRVGVHAHAADLERLGEIADPLVLDEMPETLTGSRASVEEAIARWFTTDWLDDDLRAWVEPHADLARVLVRTARLLREAHAARIAEEAARDPKDRRPVYPTRTRAVGAAPPETTAGSILDLRTLALKAAEDLAQERGNLRQGTIDGAPDSTPIGERFLTDAIARSRRAAYTVPDPPVLSRLDVQRLIDGDPPKRPPWPDPDAGDVLSALADEIEGAARTGQTACFVAAGRQADKIAVGVEVRRLAGHAWDEAEGARVEDLRADAESARGRERARADVDREARREYVQARARFRLVSEETRAALRGLRTRIAADGRRVRLARCLRARVRSERRRAEARRDLGRVAVLSGRFNRLTRAIVALVSGLRETRDARDAAKARRTEAARRLLLARRALSPDGKTILSGRRQAARAVRKWRAARLTPKRSRVILDATGRWSEDELRAALPGREVRLWSLEAVRPGAPVAHVYLSAKKTTRRAMLADWGRGTWLSFDGATLLARLVLEAARLTSERTGKARMHIGVITYKAAEVELRRAWNSLAHPDPEERSCAALHIREAGERLAPVVSVLRELRDNGNLAALTLGHFGDVRGRNHFKDVDGLLVVGIPWRNLGANAEDARTFGLPAEALLSARAEAELVQDFGRIRALWGDHPRVLIHAAKAPAASWEGGDVEAVSEDPNTGEIRVTRAAVPKGGPIPSPESRALERDLCAMSEALGVASVGLLFEILTNSALRAALAGVAKVSGNSVWMDTSIPSYRRLSESALWHVFAGSWSGFPEATLPRPEGRSYWKVRETRPGAAAELRAVLVRWKTTRDVAPPEEAPVPVGAAPLPPEEEALDAAIVEWSERAAIREEGGLSRQEAEYAAWEDLDYPVFPSYPPKRPYRPPRVLRVAWEGLDPEARDLVRHAVEAARASPVPSSA